PAPSPRFGSGSNNLYGCSGSLWTPAGAQLGVDLARVVSGHSAGQVEWRFLKLGHTLMNKQKMLGATALFAIALSAVSTLAQATQGLIVDRQITSTNFADNKIGVSPVRK